MEQFDPTLAVFYGQFVNAAYQMYGNDPNNPTPAPVGLPAGYQFFAWVQMRDFIIGEGPLVFYGLIAQSTKDTNEFVLAIRGTENLTEWLDDIVSMVPVPWGDFGSAGYGFARIYGTLQVVNYLPAGPLAAKEAPNLTFAQQVAAAVQRGAEAAPSVAAAARFKVVGHSLGSALATLYVADNATTTPAKTPLICTFASPRVGDFAFASKFNELGIASWRIVNELDLVPKLPFIDFEHVDTLYQYNSGSSVTWTLECWHSLATYLHLLDVRQPLDPGCVPARIATPLASAAHVRSATVRTLASTTGNTISVPPAGGATINITIKLEGSD
jgi:triacylglycerol lipase